MTLKQIDTLCRRVESSEFMFFVNQSSDTSSLKDRVLSDPSVKTIIDLANENDDITTNLVYRIHKLSELAIDHRYEHPKDSALATYLLVLDEVGSDLSTTAANLVIKTAQLWWAKKIAYTILEKINLKSFSRNDVVNLQGHSQFFYPNLHSKRIDQGYYWLSEHLSYMLKTYFLVSTFKKHQIFKTTVSTQLCQLIELKQSEDSMFLFQNELLFTQSINPAHDSSNTVTSHKVISE